MLPPRSTDVSAALPPDDDAPREGLVRGLQRRLAEKFSARSVAPSRASAMSNTRDATHRPLNPPTGRVTIELASRDVESLLMTTVEQLLQGYYVEVPRVEIRFAAPSPHELITELRIRAQRSFIGAELCIVAHAAIDSDRVLRIERLAIRGNNILGRFLAAMVRPRLKDVLKQSWPLDEHLPRGIMLRELSFSVRDAVAICVAFDPCLPPVGSPRSLAQRSHPTVPRTVSATPEKPQQTIAPSSRERFRLFVIDTGRDARARRIVERELAAAEPYPGRKSVKRLSVDDSRRLLERQPQWGGLDPILLFLDEQSRQEGAHQTFGCRVCLGELSPDSLARRVHRLLSVWYDRRLDDEQIIPQLIRTGRDEGIGGVFHLLGDLIRPR